MDVILLLLADGRGADEGSLSGVLLIALYVIGVALTLAAVLWIMVRASRRRRSRGGPDENPHEPGRVGRLG